MKAKDLIQKLSRCAGETAVVFFCGDDKNNSPLLIPISDAHLDEKQLILVGGDQKTCVSVFCSAGAIPVTRFDLVQKLRKLARQSGKPEMCELFFSEAGLSYRQICSCRRLRQKEIKNQKIGKYQFVVLLSDEEYTDCLCT